MPCKMLLTRFFAVFAVLAASPAFAQVAAPGAPHAVAAPGVGTPQSTVYATPAPTYGSPQPAPGYGAPSAQPGYGAPHAVAPAPSGQPAYSSNEIIETGHQIFGEVTQGLAGVVEHAVARYGQPNGYIVGEEAAGAVIGGARYGEGILYTKNAGQHRVYWQGPSIGFDLGANGDRVMMLLYNLPSIDALFQRYVGVNGSAYVVAGVGMTVLSRRGVYVVPIVSGVGARLGVNVGYLKFTTRPTWNPF